jgi:hypothetical protein
MRAGRPEISTGKPMQSVFIATPTYDEWVCVEYATALAESAARLTQAGIEMRCAIAPGNPFLDIARNKLVEKFLETDGTDLLFIDADVGWDSQVLTRVLSYEQEVVGGLVPKRDAKSDSIYHQNAITGVMSKEGLFQCLELPTAFMRIRRSAFSKLKQPYFKIGAADKDFGEDIYFCRRWVETGEFLWIDSDIAFSHRGGKLWRGNFFEHCMRTGALRTVEKAAA